MDESFSSSIPADAVQSYVDYIKGIGIEAWIPDSPGHGPKLSVADQCKSRVLCMTYLGSDIYIRGKTPDLVQRRRSAGMLSDYRTNNSTENVCDLLNASVTSSKRSVGIESKVDSSPVISPRCLEKLTQRIAENRENEPFVPGTGYSYKRIVHEKLTREVRVAKCYVSSLANNNLLNDRPTGRKELSSSDGKREPPRRGFVRQLIERFEVC